MQLVEIRQNLADTSVEQNIFDNKKIIKQIVSLAEITEDLSYTDFAYISQLLTKSQTLLYRAYTILQINHEEVESKNGKQ